MSRSATTVATAAVMRRPRSGCAAHVTRISAGKRDRHGFGEHLERGVSGEEIDHHIQGRDELRIHHGPLWCLVGGP
jgi:hypothetical protein